MSKCHTTGFGEPADLSLWKTPAMVSSVNPVMVLGGAYQIKPNKVILTSGKPMRGLCQVSQSGAPLHPNRYS